MTLTSDQKKGLLIGGGIVLLIIVFLMLRRGTVIPTAVDVQPGGTFDSLDPPGYTTYNVQPLSMPAPGISTALPPGVAGCGCEARTDGCFTSNPLDNGQGPLSLSQLLSQYGAAFPQFADLVRASQEGYAAPQQNIAELSSPQPIFFPMRERPAAQFAGSIGLWW